MRFLQALFPFHTPQAESGPPIPDPHELDRLRSAMAEASSEARNAFFYFAAFGLYFIVAVAGTTGEDLLRGSTVAMPGLGVGLPIVGFYAFVPLLFILLHLYVLLQVFVVARALNYYRIAITPQYNANQSRFKDPIASSFLTTQWLFGYQPRFIYTIIVWASLAILPLLFLVAAQVRFLPYHLDSVTWLHRWYILADVVTISPFWLLILKYRNGWLAGQASPRGGGLRAVYGILSYSLLAGLSLVTSGFVFLVATVPGEAMERCLLDENSPLWCSPFRGVRSALSSIPFSGISSNFDIKTSPDGRRMLAITYDLFEGPETRVGLRRNLVVRYAHLVVAEPPPVSASSAEEGKTPDGTVKEPAAIADELARKEQEVWEGKGINLRGRDLRFADLTGSDLRGADLRGADLKGAIVKGAKLLAARMGDLPSEQLPGCLPEDGQERKFCRTRMQGIDLSESDLRFIDGGKADLRASNLIGAKLEGAELRHSILTGANLGFAKLPDAKLRGADLRGVVMLGAEAPRAELICAHLEGALLKDTKLGGIGLAGTDLTAADLRGSSLDGATFGDEHCNPDESQNLSLHLADLTKLTKFPPGQTRPASANYPALTALFQSLDWTAPNQLPLFEGRSSEKALLYELALAKQLAELARAKDQNDGAQDGQADLNDLRRALPRGIAQRILTEYQHADDQTPGKEDVPVRDAYFVVAGALLSKQCEPGEAALSETETDGLKHLRSLWNKQHEDDPGASQTLLDNWDKVDGGVRNDAIAPVKIKPETDCPKKDD